MKFNSEIEINSNEAIIDICRGLTHNYQIRTVIG
jgi:hypothetical protein